MAKSVKPQALRLPDARCIPTGFLKTVLSTASFTCFSLCKNRTGDQMLMEKLK